MIMAKSLIEQITETKAHLNALEQKRRAENRREREKEKKLKQRRYYIIGELVCKYFPDLSKLNPGTKEQNKETFKALESLLSEISSDTIMIEKYHQAEEKVGFIIRRN